MNKQYNINKSYKIGGAEKTPAEARQLFQDAEKKEKARKDRVKEARETYAKKEREAHKRELPPSPPKTTLKSNPVIQESPQEFIPIDDSLDESESKKEEKTGLMVSVDEISEIIKKINNDFDSIITVLLENPNFYLFKFNFEEHVYYAYNMPILLNFNSSEEEVESSESDKLNVFIREINKLKLDYKIYVLYDTITLSKNIDSEYLYKIQLYQGNKDKPTLFNFVKKEDSNPVLIFILEFKLTDLDKIEKNEIIKEYFLEIFQLDLLKSWNNKFNSKKIFYNFCKNEPEIYKRDTDDHQLRYNTCMMQFKVLILSLITRFTDIENYSIMEEKVNLLFFLEKDNFIKLNNLNTKEGIRILIYILYGLNNKQLKMILEDNSEEQLEIIKKIGSMYKELVVVSEGQRIGNTEANSFINETLLKIPDYETKIQYLLENLIIKESSNLKRILTEKESIILDKLKEMEDTRDIQVSKDKDAELRGLSTSDKTRKDIKKELFELQKNIDSTNKEFEDIQQQLKSLTNQTSRESKYNTFIRTSMKSLLDNLNLPIERFINEIIF